MKNYREVCILLFFTFLGCAFFFGFFVWNNRNASCSYEESFHATQELRHVEDPVTITVQNPVNINTATAKQLQTLPGIGPELAQRILDYREKNGLFSAAVELSNIPGFGINRLEDLLGYVTTGG